eukprot:s176_g5.t1
MSAFVLGGANSWKEGRQHSAFLRFLYIDMSLWHVVGTGSAEAEATSLAEPPTATSDSELLPLSMEHAPPPPGPGRVRTVADLMEQDWWDPEDVREKMTQVVRLQAKKRQAPFTSPPSRTRARTAADAGAADSEPLPLLRRSGLKRKPRLPGLSDAASAPVTHSKIISYRHFFRWSSAHDELQPCQQNGSGSLAAQDSGSVLVQLNATVKPGAKPNETEPAVVHTQKIEQTIKDSVTTKKGKIARRPTQEMASTGHCWRRVYSHVGLRRVKRSDLQACHDGFCGLATARNGTESATDSDALQNGTQVDEHTAFAHAHYQQNATNGTDISVVSATKSCYAMFLVSVQSVHGTPRNQVITLYLFIFVPLAMAWTYYYYRGSQGTSPQQLYLLLLQNLELPMAAFPILAVAFRLYADLILSGAVFMPAELGQGQAPMALTAMQSLSMIVFGAGLTIVHFCSSESRPTLGALRKDLTFWLPAASAFGVYQLADHFEANFCSLSERTVFGNLAPVLGLFLELSLASFMQPRASEKASANLSSKMALAAKVFGATIFALQYPDFNARGMEVSTYYVISMVIYRLVQRCILGHVKSPLAVLTATDGIVCFVIAGCLSRSEVDDMSYSLHLWWSNGSIRTMLALSFVAFSVGHWATLHLVNTDTATAVMVIGNISSGFSVFQGILFFHDDDFQRPVAFAGILIVIFAGVWWTINQSMGATDKGEKQTDDGAVAVSAPEDGEPVRQMPVADERDKPPAPPTNLALGFLHAGYVPPVLPKAAWLKLLSFAALLVRLLQEKLKAKGLSTAGEHEQLVFRLTQAQDIRMPLRLDIKKKLSARSDRVKCVDFHPSEPWTLSALYSGNIFIWDYNTQTLVKQFEVCNLPVRCAKFVTRKQWIATASDDMHIRVFNYNSLEKAHEFEAHTDYIRYIAVHPTLPYLLSCSDDMSIKLWDWDKNWQNLQAFEGHAHYVMMCQWNPKDANIFASCSLDRSIKVWGVSGGAGGTSSCHFTLTGHQRGVNCVEYSPGGEKPYIISGSDDRSIKIWDYQTKQCIQTLTGHTNNDGTVRIWHGSTYRLEATLSYFLERVWSIAVLKGSNTAALGYDEGTVVIKLGSEEPVVSMHSGKIIWAKGNEIQTANLKLLDEGVTAREGEKVPLSVKELAFDMGAAEVFPQYIAHHPNGRLFAVCGDGEFVIYTAQALRNKSYGPALEFCWAHSGAYATRDGNGKITDFKESFSFKPPFTVEETYGGRLLGIRGGDFICFYDWTEYRLIRRIDVVPKDVIWSEEGNSVVLICPDSFYVLRHDKDAVQAALVSSGMVDEDGIEAAFDLQHEINDKVVSGLWGDAESPPQETLAHLDRLQYLLGYMPEQSKLYLIDKELNVTPYTLHMALIEYQSAIMRKDFQTAETFFGQLPESLHNRIARFLENQGYQAEALAISKDFHCRRT